MSKKENEHEISSLLSRLKDSLKWSKKDEAEENSNKKRRKKDSFDEDLSERLSKHLQTADAEADDSDLTESNEEAPFEVEELEIVSDGSIDPQNVELLEESQTETSEEALTAEEEAILSDLDALMARMTPEQRAAFEAEMNAAEEEDTAIPPAETQEDAAAPAVETQEQEIPQNVIELSAEIDHAVLDADEEVERISLEEEASETTEEDRLDDEVGMTDEEQQIAQAETVPAEEICEDVSDNAEADEQIEHGEVYTAVEEDEEYDLPEVEAFRALETRMTPEQRAQFEQALLEAQEAERAAKEARRLAAREHAAAAESECAPSPVPAVEDLSEETEVTESEVHIDEPAEQEAKAPNAEADEPQIIFAPPVSEEEETEEDPIFMVAEEDEDMADMPAIKVGAEPSSFIFIEPEPEEEELEDEEAALAALLARMTPEQLAKFREEMLAEEVDASKEEAEAAEKTDAELLEASVMNEEITEYPPEIEMVGDTAEKAAWNEPLVMPEETDEITEAQEEPPVSEEDPVDAILNDPDKLDELMSRLTPEQAAELKQMLQTEEENEIEPESSVSHSDGFSVNKGDPAPAWTDEAESDPQVEDPEMTLLWSETSEGSDGVLLDDSVEDIPEKEEPLKNAETAEEELYAMEISEDMTDEEISLMLGLGYEKELVYHLGTERIERVKKRAARTDSQDPEFADAYAYEGQEYRHTEQTERIRYRYGAERRQLFARLGGTAFFALLLFLYECCGVFRHAFGGIFDPAHYPVIAIMAGWQLLIFAAVFSWKKLLRGIRSAFVLEPDNHAMTAIIVAVVMFNNILMAIVFKGSSLYLYNFPAAMCLVCSVLCDLADLRREELTFEVISSDSRKYAAEAVTLNAAYTDMPIEPTEVENSNPMTARNAMYVRRIGFVKHYFRRTNRKTHHAQILNFVFLPLIAFAVVLGVVTALIGNGTVASLNTFVVTILLCMPLSYTILHTLPLFYEARRLHKQNCAIIGESTVEECNQYSTVIFEDKELFPPMLIKTKGLKLYENNLIYGVILKISLLFREIGGPINEVLDLDKEEMKRFISSGQAGNIAEGKVELERMTEDGVIATLSDGSYIVAGSAEFLQSRGIYVRPSTKDQQLLESGDMSILYLAFDGKLGARFYVDYQPDPEFEAMAGMLNEDEFRVAIRTLDPGIQDGMIAHKCRSDALIHTVRATVRELTDRVSNEARVDSGLICGDDPRKMLLLLRAIRNLRRLNRFVLKLYGGALILNMIVAIILTAFSVVGYMPSILVSLYMLVWLATSFVLTALFLNK